MSSRKLPVAGKLFAVFCMVATVIAGICAPAGAQQTPRSRGGSSGSGGGGGGLPGAGGLLLQLAPSIINKLDKDDDEPRRVKPARKRAAVQDHDDDDDRPSINRGSNPKRKTNPLPRRRVTVIPPSPPRLAAAPFPQRREAPGIERPQFRPGEIVVMVRGVAEPDAVAQQLAQGFNLVLQETLSFALLGASRVYRFSIPDNRPVETLVATLSNVPGVGYAVPNTLYRLRGSIAKRSNDLQYALPKMHVPAAQAMGRGHGAIVAVIDSGVDAKHSSLKNAHLKLYDVVTSGIAGPDMHGTAITGIIAASGDMVGIAPEAKIVAVRAFASEKLGMPPETSATTLSKAIHLAYERGARIFNMSFAGERNPLVIEMIDAVYAQGAVFVAAAGNDGPDAPPAYPAAHDKVIAITATDEADEIYGNANRGRYVLAAAPGVNISPARHSRRPM
jgi:subtilisin family serine protease